LDRPKEVEWYKYQLFYSYCNEHWAMVYARARVGPGSGSGCGLVLRIMVRSSLSPIEAGHQLWWTASR